MGIGSHESDARSRLAGLVQGTEVPADTGHYRTYGVSAGGKECGLKASAHHLGGQSDFVSLAADIVGHRELVAVNAHEVEMSVHETDINLLGVIVYVERQWLAGHLFQHIEYTLGVDGYAPLPFRFIHLQGGGHHILLVRTYDREGVS